MGDSQVRFSEINDEFYTLDEKHTREIEPGAFHLSIRSHPIRTASS